MKHRSLSEVSRISHAVIGVKSIPRVASGTIEVVRGVLFNVAHEQLARTGTRLAPAPAKKVRVATWPRDLAFASRL